MSCPQRRWAPGASPAAAGGAVPLSGGSDELPAALGTEGVVQAVPCHCWYLALLDAASGWRGMSWTGHGTATFGE